MEPASWGVDHGKPRRPLRRRWTCLRSVCRGATGPAARCPNGLFPNGRSGRARVGGSAGGPRGGRPRRRGRRGRRAPCVRGRRGSGSERVGRFVLGPRAVGEGASVERCRDHGRSNRAKPCPRTARSPGLRHARGASPLRSRDARVRRSNRRRTRQPANRGRPGARTRGIAPGRARSSAGAVRRRRDASMAFDRGRRGAPRRRRRGRRERGRGPGRPERAGAVRPIGEPPRESSRRALRSAPVTSGAPTSSSRSSHRPGTGRSTPRSRGRVPRRPCRPNGFGTCRARALRPRVDERARRPR